MNFSGDNSPKARASREQKSEDKTWWQPGLILFSRLSGWIIGPVVVALFIGNWLDKKYGKSPWLLLVCVAAAFVFSMFGIVKEGMGEMKKIEEDARKNKKEKEKRSRSN